MQYSRRLARIRLLLPAAPLPPSKQLPDYIKTLTALNTFCQASFTSNKNWPQVIIQETVDNIINLAKVFHIRHKLNILSCSENLEPIKQQIYETVCGVPQSISGISVTPSGEHVALLASGDVQAAESYI